MGVSVHLHSEVNTHSPNVELAVLHSVASACAEASPEEQGCFSALTLSVLSVPMKAGEQLVGVIHVESSQIGAFVDADERLLVTCAGLVASDLVMPEMGGVVLFRSLQGRGTWRPFRFNSVKNLSPWPASKTAACSASVPGHT